ncbi:hypothetical protein Tco_1344166 [Tanacetum coccineum]
MKIQDLIEKRIEKVGQHLNKEKQIIHTNKGKEKMVMERDKCSFQPNTPLSYNYFPAQTTSDEGSDHNPFQATSDESFDHNPFQVNSDESSDDTLKSSSEDTYAKKPTIPSEIVQWYDDYQRIVYKGRRGSSIRNATITKTKKPNSRSKHLAPITRTGSTCTTLVVPTKRPPPMKNCVLGLAAVITWQRILNKEFRIISSKQDAGGSSNVRSKGKRKMM